METFPFISPQRVRDEQTWFRPSRCSYLLSFDICISAPPPSFCSTYRLLPYYFALIPSLVSGSICLCVCHPHHLFPFLKFSRLPSFLPDGRLVRRHQTACIFSSAADGGAMAACQGPECSLSQLPGTRTDPNRPHPILSLTP